MSNLSNKKLKMTMNPLVIPRNVWGTIFSFLGVPWGYYHLGSMSKEMYTIAHCDEVLEKLPWRFRATSYTYGWGIFFTENLKELVEVIGSRALTPGVWETVQKNRQTILAHMKHITIYDRITTHPYGYSDTSGWERFMLDVLKTQLNNIETLSIRYSILKLPIFPKLVRLRISESEIKMDCQPYETFPALQHLSIDCRNIISDEFFKFPNLVTFTIDMSKEDIDGREILNWGILKRNVYNMMMNHIPKQYIRMNARIITRVINEPDVVDVKQRIPTKKQFLERCRELRKLGKMILFDTTELEQKRQVCINEIQEMSRKKEEFDIFLS
jgi:hypothetical protein